MTLLLPTIAAIGLLTTTGPVTWSFTSAPGDNGTFLIDVTAQVEKGWHLYATELPSDEGPIATSFRFTPSSDFQVVGTLSEPKPVERYDENFGMTVRYHSGNPHFILTVLPKANGPFTVEGEVEFMVCNDRTCLPPTVVPISVRVEPLVKQ
ncbi:MAG: protein-disulfide reductase DsbD N-terminal domain-containing protein [Flavobacteriales bacterium]